MASADGGGRSRKAFNGGFSDDVPPQHRPAGGGGQAKFDEIDLEDTLPVSLLQTPQSTAEDSIAYENSVDMVAKHTRYEDSGVDARSLEYRSRPSHNSLSSMFASRIAMKKALAPYQTLNNQAPIEYVIREVVSRLEPYLVPRISACFVMKFSPPDKRGIQAREYIIEFNRSTQYQTDVAVDFHVDREYTDAAQLFDIVLDFAIKHKVADASRREDSAPSSARPSPRRSPPRNYDLATKG